MQIRNLNRNNIKIAGVIKFRGYRKILNKSNLGEEVD